MESRQISQVRIRRVDGEYVCQALVAGVGHYEPADYYTDDLEDAIGTARAMIDPTGDKGTTVDWKRLTIKLAS